MFPLRPRRINPERQQGNPNSQTLLASPLSATPQLKFLSITQTVIHTIRQRLQNPMVLFWIGFALIFIAGAIIRTIRIDMPPIDFPADRQKGNCLIIDLFRNGNFHLNTRSQWMEIRLYPWIVAKTSWLCPLLAIDVWTLARVWVAIFGMVTICFAALAGYWAAAEPNASRNRRLRLSLILMAAMAFNTFHIRISRMITTESLTLAFQAGALAFFLMAYHNPKRIRYYVFFIIFFVLSGIGKIPSLIWLPGYFIYFGFNRAIRLRTRLIGAGVMILASLFVLWAYKLNPFSIAHAYMSNYSIISTQALEWMHSELWIRSYVGRTVLMLTLPGTIFAILGFLVAPWIFRLTMLCFLVLFFFLNNLNTYNFAHAILPGMALATWGIELIFDLPAIRYAILRKKQQEVKHHRLMRYLDQALAVSLIGLIIVTCYAMGPNRKVDKRINPLPQGEFLQALDVIRKTVPAKTPVFNNDNQAVLDYLMLTSLGTSYNSYSEPVNLKTGYYYSFRRFGPQAFDDIADNWVKWASIPGEFEGLLLTKWPNKIPATVMGKFVALKRNESGPAQPLDFEQLLVPQEIFDFTTSSIMIKPGNSFKIGVMWKNENQVPLAGITWQNQAWKQLLPIPIREGGFSIQRGGVLCLPQKPQTTAVYTIEIPENFPDGEYSLLYYPLERGKWSENPKNVYAFPIKVVSQGRPVASSVMEDKFFKLFPTVHDRQPDLWSNTWFYKDMELEGYTCDNSVGHFIGCPKSKPGTYEVTIEGSSIPITSAKNPDYLWSRVDVYLSSNPTQSVAQVVLSSERRANFTTHFTTLQPFDSILLQATIKGASKGKMPVWLTNFTPESFGREGQQYVRLRSFGLKRTLAPEQTVARGATDLIENNRPPLLN